MRRQDPNAAPWVALGVLVLLLIIGNVLVGGLP